MDKENENEKQEMDLFDLLKLFWQWLVKYFINPIVFLVRFAFKQWKLLGCFAVLGIIASVCYWLIYPRYQTIVVYENNVGYSGDYVTRLLLERETSIENISAGMKIPVEVVSHLKIKPHYIYYNDTTLNNYRIDMKDKYLYDNKGKKFDKNMFCVEFVSYDKSNLQDIEYSVLNLFCENKFYMAKNEQRLKELTAKVDFAVGESSILDSLRSVKYKETGNIEAFKLSDKGFLTTSDPMSYSKELMRLNDIKTASESQLTYNKDVLRIAFVSRPHQPKNFVIKTIVPFTLSFILLGFMVLLCVQYKSSIKDFIEK